MKKVIASLLLLLTLAGSLCTFTSCGNKNKQQVPHVGKSQSAPYELLLVANKDWLKTMAGQTLSVVLDSPIEGLPQPETHFRLTTIDPLNFDGTFHFYANVIQVQIGQEYKEAKVTMINDAYCTPQLILNLQAPNDEEFIKLVRDRADLILDIFDQREIERERGLLAKHYSGKVQKEAKRLFGIDFHAPEDISKVKTGKNFLWASDENEFQLNVCAYTVSMRDMNVDRFIAMRDSVMLVNIPGDKEGQWMETDSRTVSMKEKEIGDANVPVTIFRGLWDMRNDAMGGPFVSYVYTDHTNVRLLVVEGFIFAPQKDKRAFIRELEGSLRTVVMEETKKVVTKSTKGEEISSDEKSE